MRNNQNRMGTQPGVPPQSTPSVPRPTPSVHPSLAYTVPTEFVELPSKGMFYTDGHPLFGKTTVEIKYMTAKEEDILASSSLIKQGLVIERLLKSIIVNPDIDPKSLLVGDRNAIMVSARTSAYGPQYDVAVVCESCDKLAEGYPFDLGKHHYKLNFLDQKYLDDNNIAFDEESRNFVVRLPKSGLNVGVRFISGYESTSLDDIGENSVVTDLLLKFIVSVESLFDPGTVKSFVRNMPAQDSRFLRGLYLDLMPNIDLTQEFVCPHCGDCQEKEVPLDAGFFWP